MKSENNTNYSEEAILDMPIGASLIFLLVAIMTCGLLGMGIVLGLGYLWGMDFQEVLHGLSDNSTATDRNFVRLSILINHLTMFVLPGLFFTLFIYRQNWASFLRIKYSPTLINWFGGILLLLVSFPFVQYMFWINREWLPLPDWARDLEASTADTISGLLITNSSFELIFNIVIIAAIPAIGEELIFRGIIQRRLGQAIRNPVVVIWLAAFMFSAFHMQFEGFLPRLLLGALLGYLYYWSKNLWVPIIAHFMNNFLQIMAQYLYQEEMSDLDLDQIDLVPIWQWLPSLLLIFVMGYYLQQYNRERTNINKKL